MIPSILLHASVYQTAELIPGFLRTGELIRWDNTESNEWLYAGVYEKDVLLQGYASYFEKNYGAIEVNIQPKKIIITLERPLNVFIPPTIYLYTIHPRKQDGWQPVGNKNNADFAEYKTKSKVEYSNVKSVVINDALLKKWGMKVILRQST